MDIYHNQFIGDGNIIYANGNANDATTSTFPANIGNSHRISTDNIQPNVFVTIPVQSQNTQSVTSSNSNEIKSEPIKIEISEKNASNTTDVTTSITTSKTATCPSLVSARPKKSVICFKCNKCRFISLSNTGLSTHIDEMHKDETNIDEITNKKILCPGCENIFYTKSSLENHLLNDHQMNKNDIETLADSLMDNSVDDSDDVESANTSSENQDTDKSKNNATQTTKCSQKIFIKNVDNLKEPQQTRPKSKIYIKNVDILKNPIYLQPPPQIQIPPPPLSVSPAEPIPMNDDNFITDFSNVQNDIIDLNSNSNSIADNDFYDFHFPITLDCDYRHRTHSSSMNGNNSIHLRTVDELNLLNFSDMQNFMSMSSSRNEDNQINRNNDTVLDQFNIPDLINTNIDLNLDAYQEMHHDFDLNQSNMNNLVLIGDYLLQQDPQQSHEPCKVKDSNERNALTDQNYFFPCNSQTSESNNSVISTMTQEDHNRMENQQQEIMYVCAEEIVNEPTQQFFPPENIDNQDEDNNDNQLLISENTFAVDENISENDSRSERNIPVENMQNYPTCVIHHENEMNVNEPHPIALSETIPEEPVLVKQSQGRPKGSRQTSTTQKKTHENSSSEIERHKCFVPGCGLKFQKKEVFDYHTRCHVTDNSNSIICPECNSLENRNWNSLHTHLWREHLIDMELFACDKCDFKTPILSRLKNTHIKIHSEERNFICDFCKKAFKNTKQLKNHRRIHRTLEQMPVHNCTKCNLTFKNTRTLKKHLERYHNENGVREEYTCEECEKISTTKEGHKLHILSHKDDKKFICTFEICNYATNDHNAFRRHKMKHNEFKNYKCPYCNYTSIQSTSFKAHILKNHSSKANELVFRCQFCTFETINKQKFEMHQVRHANLQPPPVKSTLEETPPPIIIQINETPPPQSDDIPVSTASSSSDDLILLAPPPTTDSMHTINSHSQHFDLPLIRPAVFANNFSNIENMRFLPHYQQLTNVTPLETVDASVIANHTNCDKFSFNIDLT